MYFADMNWPEIGRLSKDTPVVIPIAAIEQHGHHLPVATDTLLLTEMIRRVEITLSDKILVAPVQWFGNSDHHLDFGGTLTASPRVYLDMLHSIVENFVSAGFKRIVLINGHGGNDVPAKQALFEVRQKHRNQPDLLLLMTTYWSLGTEPWQEQKDLFQKEMGHACEWETSMILALRPNLVGDYQIAAPVEPGNAFLPGFRAWTTKDRSEPGHIGWPHLATAEKGEHLFKCFSDDLTGWMQRVLNWDGSSWVG